MQLAGRSYFFDYGNLLVRVHYRSDTVLAWEQVEGPEPGKKGEEQYSHAEIRDDIVFFWWKEPHGILTQVVDFKAGTVHTTWTSPDGTLAGFHGKVHPA